MSYGIRSESIDEACGRWVTPTACSLLLALSLVSQPRADTLHEQFDGLLHAHVTDGEVDYPGIANDRRLGRYLDTLAATDPSTLATREQRLAYWINAYNAFAIKGILDGSSPSSFFGRIGYFKSDEYTAGGKEIDLYDLEHDILIPMKEPRIHFAIVCASKSCPKLRSEAYTAAELERQLDSQARDFVNDPTRNRFDREAKVAYLSKIFDWYDEDFASHSGSIPAYVAQYVNDPALASELRRNDYTIEYLTYDWRLNGIAPST